MLRELAHRVARGGVEKRERGWGRSSHSPDMPPEEPLL